jgi:hypothetical protein
MTIDMDSTVTEVHGHAKQGASYGYTRQLGYHPILATRADTGEVLHVRQRKGSANTGRGAERFVNEVVGRVRRAGAAGPLTMRADSGFHSAKVIAACQRHDVRFSITVNQTQPVKAAIGAIDPTAWAGWWWTGEGDHFSASNQFSAKAGLGGHYDFDRAMAPECFFYRGGNDWSANGC